MIGGRITRRRRPRGLITGCESSRRSPRWRGGSTQRIGWNRIGMAVSAAMVAGALFILYRLLRHIDVDKVVAAIQATPPQAVAVGVRVRRRRLRHADVLRLLRAAHDRPARGALPHRGARQLHQLHDRPQSRCDGLHGRRGAPAHLFGVGPRHRRRGEDRLRHRADVLARQHLRARLCAGLCARRGNRRDADAGVGHAIARARRACSPSPDMSPGCCRDHASSAARAGRSRCRMRASPWCRSASAFSISRPARWRSTC